jgi:hypothetical protein
MSLFAPKPAHVRGTRIRRRVAASTLRRLHVRMCRRPAVFSQIPSDHPKGISHLAIVEVDRIKNKPK